MRRISTNTVLPTAQSEHQRCSIHTLGSPKAQPNKPHIYYMRNSPSQRSHNKSTYPSKGLSLEPPLRHTQLSPTYSSTLLFEKGELGEKSLSLKLPKKWIFVERARLQEGKGGYSLGKVDYVDCLECVRFFGSSILVLLYFSCKRTFEIDQIYLYLLLLVCLLAYKRCNRTRVDACIVLEEFMGRPFAHLHRDHLLFTKVLQPLVTATWNVAR